MAARTICAAILISVSLVSIVFSQSSNNAQRLQNSTQKSPISGRPIWTGKSEGFSIHWTTKDLFVTSGSRIDEIWGPLVRKGWQDFKDSEASGYDKPLECDYERSFRVLSVVGSLVSFEDGYYEDCGGAHPGTDTRFTTVDVSKTDGFFYAKGDDPMMDVDPKQQTKIAILTDYFSEKDILAALLADRIIKKAIASLEHPRTPKTLSELPRLFANDYYGMGDIDFELRPDFLTRFAFHHIERGKIAVRLGFPPHSGANQSEHMQIGLLLPISPALKTQLANANARRNGFLMKDAERIAHGSTTKFTFTTRT